MVDKDNHSHNHAACTCFPVTTSVHQTLSEMDWERGIWYAGEILIINMYLLRKHVIEKCKSFLHPIFYVYSMIMGNAVLY